MATLRTPHDKENPYVCISKTLAEGSGLSAEARGVMLYLLSKPNDWDVNALDLCREFDSSEGRIYRIINELIAKGFLERKIIRDSATKRIIKSQYSILESPQVEKPQVEKPQVEKRGSYEVMSRPSNELKEKDTSPEYDPFLAFDELENRLALRGQEPQPYDDDGDFGEYDTDYTSHEITEHDQPTEPQWKIPTSVEEMLALYPPSFYLDQTRLPIDAIRDDLALVKGIFDTPSPTPTSQPVATPPVAEPTAPPPPTAKVSNAERNANYDLIKELWFEKRTDTPNGVIANLCGLLFHDRKGRGEWMSCRLATPLSHDELRKWAKWAHAYKNNEKLNGELPTSPSVIQNQISAYRALNTPKPKRDISKYIATPVKPEDVPFYQRG